MTIAVHYTKEAERDLERIATYTHEVWGEAQRDSYLTVLEETCEQILPKHLHLARQVPEYPGMLRWRVESHMIYLREVADGIEIVRILHARMVPDRHL